MASWPYLMVSVALTLVSLFAADFTVAWLPKQCDTPCDVLLTVLWALFLVEIVCLLDRSIAQPRESIISRMRQLRSGLITALDGGGELYFLLLQRCRWCS